MANQVNYYLLLDLPLDPPVEDNARLEKAIQAKEAEWRCCINHPRRGLMCKSLMEKSLEIRNCILRDDASRSRIIADARRIVRGRIVPLVEALSKVGVVTEAQLSAVCRKFQPWFSEKTIRSMVRVPIVRTSVAGFHIPRKTSGLPIKSPDGRFGDPTAPSKIAPPVPQGNLKPMDRSLMDKIEMRLEVLGKRDVYDFLGCTRITAPSVMCRLANDIIEEARMTARKTAEVAASHDLASLVTFFFKKPLVQQSYDLALKTYAWQEKLVEVFSLRCISKSVDWESYQLSIAECREIGMTDEEAEYFVYDFYCRKRKCPPPTVTGKE